jgi:hypothetical protein
LAPPLLIFSLAAASRIDAFRGKLSAMSLYAEPPSGVKTLLQIFLKGVKLSGMAKIPASVKAYFREEGRKGGKLSAAARMQKMTPAQRKAIAKKAAKARWAKKAAQIVVLVALLLTGLASRAIARGVDPQSSALSTNH